MDQHIKVYTDEVFCFINRDFVIETWAEDCLFTEGPVWNDEGFYLFSDTTANCIYRISGKGNKEIFIQNSGITVPDDPDLKKGQEGSNGLGYTSDGRLLVCRHGSHDLAVYDGTTLHSLVASYNGRPLNSPNDLIVHPDGRIYFSDPPYGLKDSRLNPEKFQPLAGVYCYRDGKTELVCDRYQYPNGVCLSPDHQYLYICSNKPFEQFISVYATPDHSFVKVFAEETSDGMETDGSGNIYLCNKEGIIILDGEGKRMALISLPTIPANCCWGGEGNADLLVTGREKVYCFRRFRRS